MNNKDMKKMMAGIESLGVEIVDVSMSKHIKLRIKTGTVRLITVSKSPRSKGVYDEVKSSVRKIFRKEGEEI